MRTSNPPGSFSVADDLHSVAIRLLRGLRKEDTKAGLGPARLSALSVLVFGGPSTVGALAAAEQVKPPTMTRIVAGLEKEGLVGCERDRRDARVVRVRATRKGRRLLAQARDRRVSNLARRLEELSPDEFATVREAVTRLKRIFCGSVT